MSVVTWEEVACMGLSFFIFGPGLPGSDDPFEFCPMNII